MRTLVTPGRTLLAALLLTTLAVSACDPSSDSSDDSSGGTFIVARTADIDGRDPATATAFQTTQTLDLVYDTLVETNDAGDIEPSLATDWQVSGDGKTVTLTLRTDATFQNGDPFTAADAKATLDRVLDPKTGSVVASNLGNVKSVNADGDDTLVIELSQPDTALLNVLAQTGTAMLDHKDIEAGDVGREVNGTGPFSWASWKQGEKVTLEANKDYWGDVPQLDTIEMRVIPDEASILSGMRAGSFDLGVITDPSIAKQVDTDDMQLESQPTLSYHVLQLNAARGPLKDERVRQAIACAIDREQVVKTAYFGQGEITGPITSPGYDLSPTDGLPCDPPDTGAAEDLLDKAGYGDGFTLKTIVMVGEYATATNIAQSVQAQLKSIGVDLDLQQQQINVYVDNWLDANYDAAVALNGGGTDPYLMYARYWGKNPSLAKPAGLADPKLEQLLTEANSTTDEGARADLFDQLQQRLLELSPWVWLQQNQSYYLLGNDVDGFEAQTTESLEALTQTTLEPSG